jgi:hypothetical protein
MKNNYKFPLRGTPQVLPYQKTDFVWDVVFINDRCMRRRGSLYK